MWWFTTTLSFCLHPKVIFGRLDADVSQKKLDLLQSASHKRGIDAMPNTGLCRI
jgi:hypothetical protein